MKVAFSHNTVAKLYPLFLQYESSTSPIRTKCNNFSHIFALGILPNDFCFYQKLFPPLPTFFLLSSVYFVGEERNIIETFHDVFSYNTDPNASLLSKNAKKKMASDQATKLIEREIKTKQEKQ